MPPDGPDCWPATYSKRQWIVFYRADEMTLQGEGTVEGNGENWWNLPCKPHRVLIHDAEFVSVFIFKKVG